MKAPLPIVFALASFFVAIAGPACADGGIFEVTSGYDITSGKYGATSATVTQSVPFDFSYENDWWDFSLIVPYLIQSGPGSVLRGIGQIKAKTTPAKTVAGATTIVTAPTVVVSAPTVVSSTSSQFTTGIGDIVASTGFTLYPTPDPSGFNFDLRLKGKTGSASRRLDLGDGTNDYSAQIDLSQVIGNADFYLTGTYTRLGNSSSVQISKKYFGGYIFGADYNVTDNFYAGVLYENGGTLDASDAPANIKQITGYMDYVFSEKWEGEIYVLGGSSVRSPDVSTGFYLTYSL